MENRILKGNDLQTILVHHFELLIVRKSLKEYIGRYSILFCLHPLHCQNLPLKHPSWRYESHATFHLYSSVRLMSELVFS